MSAASAGADLEGVRRIRDEISQRVRTLLDELAPGNPASESPR